MFFFHTLVCHPDQAWEESLELDENSEDERAAREEHQPRFYQQILGDESTEGVAIAECSSYADGDDDEYDDEEEGEGAIWHTSKQVIKV